MQSTAASMIPKRGRPGALIMMSIARALTARDLMNLAANPGARKGPPMIQRLKAAHHQAARLLVEGKTVREVALITGYSRQRLSDMQRTDPMFIDLMSYYEGMTNELGVDDTTRIRNRLVDAGETALIEIQDRLDDDATRSKMSIDELRKISEMGLDRTVAPPRTAIPNTVVPTRITFNIGDRDLRPKNGDDAVITIGDDDDPKGSG